MQREGIRRQGMYKWGRYLDIVEYGILREEFYALRNAGTFSGLLSTSFPERHPVER